MGVGPTDAGRPPLGGLRRSVGLVAVAMRGGTPRASPQRSSRLVPRWTPRSFGSFPTSRAARISDRQFFQEFIRRIFTQRRKHLRGVLASEYRKQISRERIETMLLAESSNPNVRAEELNPDQLVRIAIALQAELAGVDLTGVDHTGVDQSANNPMTADPT